MYIKSLKNWSEDKWARKLAPFCLTEDEYSLVKQILTLPQKHAIEWHFDTLKRLWIINWLGPWWIPWFVRAFLSWLFPFIQWEWHDIMIWLAESDEDVFKADRWLLKYSHISITEKSLERFYDKSIIVITLDIWICKPLKNIIWFFMYLWVRLGSRFSTNF